MKLVALIGAAAGLTLLCSTTSGAAEAKKKRATHRASIAEAPSTAEKGTLATRRILIDRRKALRDRLKNSLPLYEAELKKQEADFLAKKELYSRDLISETEVANSERALANKRLEITRVREWIAEDDHALSLAEQATQEKLASLSPLPPGAYHETTTLIHYNGMAAWSRSLVQRIAKFYRGEFGRELPLSAQGQSSTHERMGLDHREALDVAVRPDSREGRSLMAFLKNNGIPFIAFRGAIPNVSTGAHIHVGKPSPRIIEAKPRLVRTQAAEKNARDTVAHDRSRG